MRRDRFDAEGPQQQREHERRRREPVVDHEPEAAGPNRVDVDPGEEVLRVGLAHACRIRDRADVAETDTPQLAAREVLLDLLLHRRGQLDPRLLEEADLHDLGIRLAHADVEPGLVALALEQVPCDCGGQHTQVADLEPGRGEAGDHRPLDHPARR